MHWGLILIFTIALLSFNSFT
uniref:Uncharacterized protein n=1 Tax=candidate division WOR-3 bacterium TaxID=2052148 RepID=A0A7V3ZUE3_UNCW3